MLKAIVLLLAFAFDSAFAQQSVQDAVGSKVIAVGEVEEYACPGLGIYDCSNWPASLYRFKDQNICFTLNEVCDFECTAMLVEKNAEQSILLFGSRYGDKILKAAGQVMECPES
ncbi:hypothetical protein [Pseudomonas auratipiscis]|uniref:Uncharacterized protein n=1 Tax=Pseudomonas auratipiscis TaxID=3115853 RepID=A0AB35WW35_9PSED|nr:MULTISPECIES: hypothetical protein [unclassified Pseudomonas]MEE1868455.1 hypothetical protein [Pseudomonas sp. 120P]MEE1960870.1 hypothetical protein [Pseudomonas sp. 119P]